MHFCIAKNRLSNHRELLLPNFQRDFVWGKEKQEKSLVTSILCDIPIGNLLILKSKKECFSTKEIEGILEDIILYLLDGQQ